jgi:hypothetical protein
MAKVKVNRDSITQKVSGFVKRLEGETKREELLTQIGNEVIKDIQRETRSRRGFKSKEEARVFGSKRTKLPDLAESTIENRRSIARREQTQATYSDKRSNLTLTGQLLDSLKMFISRGVLKIRPDGKRRPYKTIKKSRAKRPPSNDELAVHLEDKGFIFMGIDDKSLKKIKTISIRFLRRLLKS